MHVMKVKANLSLDLGSPCLCRASRDSPYCSAQARHR